ncbi:hypothetical protein H4R33_002704 [Dimargaris cristalligena]|nr:hypothetical protein H4R33_002704 [Dimargaris cristalligena]
MLSRASQRLASRQLYPVVTKQAQPHGLAPLNLHQLTASLVQLPTTATVVAHRHYTSHPSKPSQSHASRPTPPSNRTDAAAAARLFTAACDDASMPLDRVYQFYSEFRRTGQWELVDSAHYSTLLDRLITTYRLLSVQNDKPVSSLKYAADLPSLRGGSRQSPGSLNAPDTQRNLLAQRIQEVCSDWWERIVIQCRLPPNSTAAVTAPAPAPDQTSTPIPPAAAPQLSLTESSWRVLDLPKFEAARPAVDDIERGLILIQQPIQVWRIMSIMNASGASPNPLHLITILQQMYNQGLPEGPTIAQSVCTMCTSTAATTTPSLKLVRALVDLLTMTPPTSSSGPQRGARKEFHRDPSHAAGPKSPLNKASLPNQPPSPSSSQQRVDQAAALVQNYLNHTTGVDPDLCARMARAYWRLRDREQAMAWYRKIAQQPSTPYDPASIGMMVAVLGSMRAPEEMIQVLQTAVQHQIPVDSRALGAAVATAVSTKNWDLLACVEACIPEPQDPCELDQAGPTTAAYLDPQLATDLVGAYSIKNDREQALRWLAILKRYNLFPYLRNPEINRVIRSLGHLKEPQQAWALLSYLIQKHVTPSSNMWVSMLHGCLYNHYFAPIPAIAAAIEKQANAKLQTVGYQVYGDLARAYAAMGHTEQVRALFDRAINIFNLDKPIQNSSFAGFPWNSLLNALVRAGLTTEVWATYELTSQHQRNNHLSPDLYTFGIMLNFCRIYKQVEALAGLLSDMRILNIPLEPIHSIYLADLYAQVGQTTRAHVLLTELRQQQQLRIDAKLGGLIIKLYCDLGEISTGVALFEYMRGAQPQSPSPAAPTTAAATETPPLSFTAESITIDHTHRSSLTVLYNAGLNAYRLASDETGFGRVLQHMRADPPIPFDQSTFRVIIGSEFDRRQKVITDADGTLTVLVPTTPEMMPISSSSSSSSSPPLGLPSAPTVETLVLAQMADAQVWCDDSVYSTLILEYAKRHQLGGALRVMALAKQNGQPISLQMYHALFPLCKPVNIVTPTTPPTTTTTMTTSEPPIDRLVRDLCALNRIDGKRSDFTLARFLSDLFIMDKVNNPSDTKTQIAATLSRISAPLHKAWKANLN